MKALQKFDLDKSVDIRTRHPVLRKLEGWYEAAPVLEGSFRHWYENWVAAQTDVKIGKWLLRRGLSESFVSELGKQLVTTQFKFSCRHADLLRLAETYHYKTCMENPRGLGSQQLRYLGDPDIAIIYVPDKAGKYVWRSIVRLIQTQHDYALVHYRVYGNGPSQSIFAKIGEHIRVYPAVDIKNRRFSISKRWLQSPTVHNNETILRTVWTDHPIRVRKDNRLEILVDTDEVF